MNMTSEQKEFLIKILKREVKEKTKRLRAIRPIYENQPQHEIEDVRDRWESTIDFIQDIVNIMEAD
jgi:hypothetical protein